jgi:hypothetical protein
MPFEEISDLTAAILFWSIFSDRHNIQDIQAMHIDFADFSSWQALIHNRKSN